MNANQHGGAWRFRAIAAWAQQRWILLACWGTCLVLETGNLLFQEDWHQSLLMMACDALLLAVPWLPRAASTVFLIVQSVYMVVPMTMGSTEVWGLCLAAGCLGFYASFPLSLGLLIIPVAALYIDYQAWSTSMAMLSWLDMVALVMFAFMTGKGMLWGIKARSTDRLRNLYERREERMRSAAALHDSLSSQLSYLALLSERDALHAASPTDANGFDELHRGLVQALDGMHEVITLLEGNPGTGSGDPVQDTHREPDASMSLVNHLRTLIEEQDQRTASLGLHGSGHVEGDVDRPGRTGKSSARNEACRALIAELYANIMRHCGDGDVYEVSVKVSTAGVRIEQWNTCRGSAPDLPRSGTGLRLLRKQWERLGGTLEAGPTAAGWHCVAFMSYPSGTA